MFCVLMNVTTQTCFILTTTNHHNIYYDQRELLNDFLCLNECNHPKLFYFNHCIIYCDQRKLLSGLCFVLTTSDISYCDQREWLNNFLSLLIVTTQKCFILTTT